MGSGPVHSCCRSATLLHPGDTIPLRHRDGFSDQHKETQRGSAGGEVDRARGHHRSNSIVLFSRLSVAKNDNAAFFRLGLSIPKPLVTLWLTNTQSVCYTSSVSWDSRLSMMISESKEPSGFCQWLLPSSP